MLKCPSVPMHYSYIPAISKVNKIDNFCQFVYYALTKHPNVYGKQSIQSFKNPENRCLIQTEQCLY